MPDQSKLDPTVVQLPPFEVIGGIARPATWSSPGKRFFQYQYRCALIDEARSAPTSPCRRSRCGYRIESQVARGEAVRAAT